MRHILLLGLLCVVPIWGQTTDTSTPSPPESNPPDVKSVAVIDRTESEITLQWERDNSNYTYLLKYSNVPEISINGSLMDSIVTYKVSDLTAGTRYLFTLYTVLSGLRSNGYNFSNVTAPSDVNSVEVIARTEFDLTLQWNQVNTNYTYVLKFSNGTDTVSNITRSETDSIKTCTVSNLSAGTQYSFTLYTEFEGVSSKGYNFSNFTAPSDVNSVEVIARTEFDLTLQWNQVNTNYTYVLKFSNGTDTVSNITRSETDSVKTCTVSNLSAGTQYSFTLYTEFEGVSSRGYNFSKVTKPSTVDSVSVINRNDTDMILQWNMVTNRDNNTYTYLLEYRKESWQESITISSDDNSAIISNLIPATNYNFTLYTLFKNVTSNGYNFTNSTTLSDVTEVNVTQRSQNQLTIKWNKLIYNYTYNYTLYQSDGNLVHFTDSQGVFTHEISSLTPGTEYNFTLFTVVNNFTSSGYFFKNVTTIDCASINWKVTNSSITAEVEGCTNVTAKNITDSEQIGSVNKNIVNIDHLYPGAVYTILLWYDLGPEKLLQCTHNQTLVPNCVSQLRCQYLYGGYGLSVHWDPPVGIVQVVQVDVDGKIFNQSRYSQDVKGLQAAQWYKVAATSISGDLSSDRVTVNCQTDPKGVIAGVLVFFLLLIIICVGVFIWFRISKQTSKQTSKRSNLPMESKIVPNNKYTPIHLEKFPEHFQKMSRDENRGFSEEYEDLSSVGTEQSRSAALLPENKKKNRFSNVLAYDCSRVHLTINDEGDSDYINANYMPGFGSAKREYIAAQGPLPNTVNDFWRMIWEKRSGVIIMVTNCIESGRTKCEQYWPLDYTPCIYGNLLVTIISENKAQSWTLREFTVKNKETSEIRTVRHFHFTAWPDHGVPESTEELIRFRGLVRQHIESSSSAGPTVVHCSAGVGRTGTLIALDVLLQQLQTEKAVGIAAFIHSMRLNRPLMVQTESQYVFLHQCIMDTLQPKTEALYENSDMIYVNAMAMKEYESGNRNYNEKTC
ncbi:receptor-type tyrosine-protein phosphatase H-like isoform X4 [Xyrauchen texanus]|uniref:receptor-type tyrosine-protein phosphatase H-like isoform X4 n=1 Tax=Xyrauchen texanus TaxID=154827 RepID=UPI0022425224|nr:receptor-type tyrosine-protein phosphatase H-like isoform X4 [Xyrauchen texanus]